MQQSVQSLLLPTLKDLPLDFQAGVIGCFIDGKHLLQMLPRAMSAFHEICTEYCIVVFLKALAGMCLAAKSDKASLNGQMRHAL